MQATLLTLVVLCRSALAKTKSKTKLASIQTEQQSGALKGVTPNCKISLTVDRPTLKSPQNPNAQNRACRRGSRILSRPAIPAALMAIFLPAQRKQETTPALLFCWAPRRRRRSSNTRLGAAALCPTAAGNAGRPHGPSPGPAGRAAPRGPPGTCSRRRPGGGERGGRGTTAPSMPGRAARGRGGERGRPRGSGLERRRCSTRGAAGASAASLGVRAGSGAGAAWRSPGCVGVAAERGPGRPVRGGARGRRREAAVGRRLRRGGLRPGPGLGPPPLRGRGWTGTGAGARCPPELFLVFSPPQVTVEVLLLGLCAENEWGKEANAALG